MWRSNKNFIHHFGGFALSARTIPTPYVKDSGMENLDARAIAALWSAGATIPGGKEREGYALIGVKGGRELMGA